MGRGQLLVESDLTWRHYDDEDDGAQGLSQDEGN